MTTTNASKSPAGISALSIERRGPSAFPEDHVEFLLDSRRVARGIVMQTCPFCARSAVAVETPYVFKTHESRIDTRIGRCHVCFLNTKRARRLRVLSILMTVIAPIVFGALGVWLQGALAGLALSQLALLGALINCLVVHERSKDAFVVVVDIVENQNQLHLRASALMRDLLRSEAPHLFLRRQ